MFRHPAWAPLLPFAIALVAACPGPAHATTVPDGFVHEFLVGEPYGGWPVGFALLPDGRVIIIERETGVARLAAVGSGTSVPILTIPDVESAHVERGLLGVAVDPDWPVRPYVYFDYTAVDSVSKVVRYEASGDLSDPASTALVLADPYVVLDSIEDLFGIHNAGTLRFAPDATLYVSVGDDQRGCLAQDLDVPHGKILRLDVGSLPAGPGGPPPLADLDPGDNPFGGTGWRPLVFAWGLRNPFRFTVDAPTGDLFIGSVGSHTFEEINRVDAGGEPGPNFGWPEYEGFFEMNCCGDCPLPVTYTFPIHVIPHPLEVISVIGGPRMRHVASSPLGFPPDHDGSVFFLEIYSGDLGRLTESAGTWSLAAPIPGQPAPDLWGDGFIGAADAQLGPDGALWLCSLGLNGVALPRGIHRVRADTTSVAAPWTPGGAGPAVRAEPNPARAGDAITLRWEARSGEPARVRIHDASGRLVRALDDPSRSRGGRALFWDGRDDAGRPVAAGLYFARVTGPAGPAGVAKITIVR